MQERAETSEICLRGQRLKRELAIGQVYHAPDFSTLSTAKPRHNRAAKAKLKRKKPPKIRGFNAQDLF